MDEFKGGGVHKKLLEIDLTLSKSRLRKLNKSLLQDYIGGRALATRIFFDAVNPSCDPLSPENIIVIASSPLIGTSAPTATRGHMVFKSPLTGFIGSSNCGGTWARYMKSAGYDAVLIKGKAKKPVTLHISPESVRFESAEKIWGYDVHKTTDILKKNSKKNHILCIGPAGENLVKFSSVMNNKNRAYGRGGPGAVFGSKNLKAICVSGNEKTSIEKKEIFKAGKEQAEYIMKASPITKRLLKELGTSGLFKLINVMEMLPHNNFQDNIHSDHKIDEISGERIKKNLLRRAGACFGCPIACQRHTSVNGQSGEGPEYETLVMLGPQCEVYDLKSITKANYSCNELGLDTISMGGTTACVMELFEKGLISTQDTNGIKFSFGRAEMLEQVTQLVAYRKGIGDQISEGSYRFAELFNHPSLSMSVKKLEIPAYDPRASFTQALGYMTSPTGACHLRGGYAVSLAFFGGTKEIPRFSQLQSPIAIRNMQNLGIIQDSLGVCRFTGFAFSTEPWSRMLSGVTGYEYSSAEFEKMANRVAALERVFNLRAGLKYSDDSLPQRFSSQSITVQGKKTVLSNKFQTQMREDYYKARRWSVPEGIPSKKTLETIGLEGI
ncbi:MAG: aldehyde ferredoxin oxidoreductase family protein [Candidatus Aminicenantes bacterium]